MTQQDDTITEGQPDSGQSNAKGIKPPEPVTIAEFEVVDIEAPLKGNKNVEAHALGALFIQAYENIQDKNEASARCYWLLGQICNMHLRVEDKATPWGPLFTLSNGSRSPIPADYKGEQNLALESILPRLNNTGLQARLADVAWSNNKRLGRVAIMAIEAYRQNAEGLMDGAFEPYLNDHALYEALQNLQRAVEIARNTSKNIKGNILLPERLKQSLLRLYQASLDTTEYSAFKNASELLLDYNLLEADSIATNCEAVANKASPGTYPMAIKGLYDLAARLHLKLKNNDAQKRCQMRSVNQLLAMRDSVSGSAAKGHWVQQASLAVRHIEGEEELEDKLILELRSFQRAATKELATLTIPLEVDGLREEVIKVFGALDLVEALKQFSLLAQSVPIEDLKREALDTLESSPLLAMMSARHIDDEGRTAAISPGADRDGDQSAEWYRATILRGEGIRWQRAMAGLIEPARLMIHTRFGIEERHLRPIIYQSPFIPPTQAPIITLGLTRYFQGDFMSAVHLLITQIEPCLRHILKINGHDPVRRRDDGTEEDYTLDGMLSNMRAELERIFGADMIYEIDLLFAGGTGPSLRNELCHGKTSAGDCYSPITLYGCWVLYRLCSAFLWPDWDKLQFEPSVPE